VGTALVVSHLHHTANDEWLQAKLLYPVDDASRVPKGINEGDGSFSKGVILLRMLSIEFWLICDMIVKKNETSLSAHMQRETRRFDIDRPNPVPPYSYETQ